MPDHFGAVTKMVGHLAATGTMVPQPDPATNPRISADCELAQHLQRAQARIGPGPQMALVMLTPVTGPYAGDLIGGVVEPMINLEEVRQKNGKGPPGVVPKVSKPL